MPSSIGRDEVHRLITEEEAQVVEVLPRAQYEWAHLPGAVHLALEDLEALAERMHRAGVDEILVTSSDGRLLGLLTHDGAARVLAERGS